MRVLRPLLFVAIALAAFPALADGAAAALPTETAASACVLDDTNLAIAAGILVAWEPEGSPMAWVTVRMELGDCLSPVRPPPDDPSATANDAAVWSKGSSRLDAE